MRKLFFALLILTGCQKAETQVNYSDTLRIVFMGNSHCNGAGATTDDSTYRGRIVTYLKTIYPHVIVCKLCNGGESTWAAMPNWYSGSWPAVNIDTAIKFNPDFVFMEYSGNDIVSLGMTVDETERNHRYLHDTLTALGIKLAMTGNAPRQKTFVNGLTQQGYKDTSLAINSWLQANYPDHYVNIWDTLLRADNSGKAKSEYLYLDSLHFNNTGHQKFAQTVLNSPVMQQLTCNCKGMALGLSITKVGDSVRIYASDIVAGRVELYGSNDLSNYVLLNYWKMPTGVFDKKHYGSTYMYYQVRILSGYRPTMTKTKQIN